MSLRGERFAAAFFERLSTNQDNSPGSRDEDRLLDAVSAGDSALCRRHEYPSYHCHLEPGHDGPCVDG